MCPYVVTSLGVTFKGRGVVGWVGEGTYPEACKDGVGRVRDLMKGLVGRGGYCIEGRDLTGVWSRLVTPSPLTES